MRSAIVVVPVCASLAAGALLGLQLRARPARPPAVIVAPLPVASTAASVVVVPMPVAPPQPAVGGYNRPVGGQFLDENLLLDYPDVPAALLEPHTGGDAFRYGWRYENLAGAMAKELADVIDDACPDGCDASRATRAALETWLDDGTFAETHALKRWKTDDDVAPTYMRRLTVHAMAGAIALDVTCTASSDYIGMRGWNDAVSCDAAVRERGHLLATYAPRRQSKLVHGTWMMPADAWDQRVTFASAELVTHTGDQRERGPVWTTP